MVNTQKAFTLIEMLVTVCVMGILVSIAIPAFNKQIANKKSVALGDDFVNQLNLARYEAIKRAKRIAICASSNSTSASPSCTGDWKDGYIVFEDQATSDDASSPDLGSTPKIIKAVGKADAKAAISVKRDNTTSVTFLRYTSLGGLGRVSGASSIDIDAKLDGCKMNNKRVIKINVSGMLTVKKASC